MKTIPHTQIAAPAVTCSTCAACCCQLEVMLITDTGVPERYIDTNDWVGKSCCAWMTAGAPRWIATR